MISRRGVLRGLLAAPVIIRTPGLLMPIKPLSATPPVFYAWDAAAAGMDMTLWTEWRPLPAIVPVSPYWVCMADEQRGRS